MCLALSQQNAMAPNYDLPDFRVTPIYSRGKLADIRERTVYKLFVNLNQTY